VTIGDLFRGAWVALRVPRWLDPDRLPLLLAVPELPAGRNVQEPSAETIRAARGILRRLERIPGGRWRGTCLYRSAAEVLLLRAGGQPARLQLGVQHAGEEVGAHAWVECDGRPVGPDAAEADRYTALRTHG
jgi:hypothetical protein